MQSPPPGRQALTIATDATSAAAATISRAILSGIASKQAGDTLTVTWTHTILGA